MSWWWSWFLAIMSAAGLLVAGDRRRSGWLMCTAVQPFWVVYAITSRQWGFIGGAALFGFVNIRNWLRWRSPAEDRRDGPCW